MRFVTDEKSKQEYKKFLETNERCNFQQSLEWAEVKKPNWKPEVILAEDENKNIIGSLCVWIRKMPIFGNMMYASRGPVCDIHDIKVMKQLTDGAKELAKKYNAFVLRIEPDILSDDQEFRKVVTSLGYKIKDDAKDFKDEIKEITSIELLEDNGKDKKYILKYNGTEDIRKVLFKKCVEKDITIIEMKKKEVSLEEAFLKITEEGENK
jgi:lipid II:glycine glycyltransferase (peptidoglycan interpeptide bridge formation enzyme)